MYDYTFKVLMLGHNEAQKTALTIRIISGFFYPDFKLTIGVDFYSKTVYHKGRNIKLQIWDPGGEDSFRFSVPQYCRGSNIAMFIYDITKPFTLEILPEFINIVREYAGSIPIGLVGIKDSTYTWGDKDLSREILFEDGVRIAIKQDLSFFTELSPKTGENIEKFVEFLCEFLMDYYSYNVKTEVRETRSSPALGDKELKNKKGGDAWIGFEMPLEMDYPNGDVSEISKEIDTLLEEYENWEVFSIVYLEEEKIINFRRKRRKGES